MIVLDHVTKVYHPNHVALQDVSLAIGAGEFVSIIGQSGAGKTTLAKLLIADERPTQGKVSVGGWDVGALSVHDVPLLRRQIGVIFQDYKLLPKKSVFENVAFALEVIGASRARIRDIVPQVLRVVGLEEKAGRFPTQLSGGEQQRVVIARALVHQPKILLADEPTGNLDTLNTRDIIDALLKVNQFGTTIILVTHNREVVNAVHRRVITLKNGQIHSDQHQGKYALAM